jgi:mycothiol synthase
VGLPGGHVLRAAEREDVEAVFEVAAAGEWADARREWLMASDIARAWRLPGFDLERDAWVVEEPGGAIVAAAWLLIQPGAAIVYVHPRACGRGIGSALREVVEARAAEVIGGRTTLKQHAVGDNDAARALLEAAGYEPAHRYTSMRTELAGPVAEPVVPTGIELRSFVPGADDRAVYDVDYAAFDDAPDFTAQTFDFWQSENARAEALRPEASPIAWAGDDVVGFALCHMRGGGLGYVAILAVAAGHRRRGLGRALLTWSFSALGGLGATAVELGVEGSNARGRRLYESAGMQADYVINRYEKRLA